MNSETQQYKSTIPEDSVALLMHVQMALTKDEQDAIDLRNDQIGAAIEQNQALRNERLKKMDERVDAQRRGEKSKSILQKKSAEIAAIKDVESAKSFLKGLFKDQRHSIDMVGRQQEMVRQALESIDRGTTTVLSYKDAEVAAMGRGSSGTGMEKAMEGAVAGQYMQRTLAEMSRSSSASQTQGALSKQQSAIKKQLDALKKMAVIGSILKAVQIASYIVAAAVTITTMGAGSASVVAANAAQNMATGALQKIAATIAQKVTASVAQKAVTSGAQKATMTALQKALMTAVQKVIPAVVQVTGKVSSAHYGGQINDAQIATDSAQKMYVDTQQAQSVSAVQEQKLQALADKTAQDIKKALLST